MNYQDLMTLISNSAFNHDFYDVDIDLRNLPRGLMPFIYEPGEPERLFEYATPSFQRDSDCWTLRQQIAFVENCILGFKPSFLLYHVDGKHGEVERNYILDGLQRLTAISDFENGKFKVFDGAFDHQELIDNRVILPMRYRANIKIYTFKSESEAVRFYIDFNRGITHSDSDIERAEKYLKSIQEK